MSDFAFQETRLASAATRLKGEQTERRQLVARLLPFNVKFLDDALGGILPNDLIILGARTGAGKTALGSLIAQENAKRKRRITYIALEAEDREIERRMKYRALVDMFYASGASWGRDRLNYRDWYLGRLDDVLGVNDEEATNRLVAEYATLSTYYRGESFDLAELEKLFLSVQDQADLIVLDHLHYVDSDDTNENRAFKVIVKRIRDVSLGMGVPVLLIAHLRKRERGKGAPLMPDLEDFMGTSDIVKIATKVILLAPSPRGENEAAHLWGTFMAIPKDRMDGTTSHYVAAIPFDVRKGAYEDEYLLGRIVDNEFKSLTREQKPKWANRSVTQC